MRGVARLRSGGAVVVSGRFVVAVRWASRDIYGGRTFLGAQARMSNGGITEVGKYRVLERVGEGAMGVVYRAMDPVLNRTVAIKVMNDSLARDDELRGRFLREAQAAGSLAHPNLVTIYDFGEVDGHLFIAMEFVAGYDLETLLSKRETVSVEQKIDIIVDVLSGLAYAHKRGIVHRDIKPANIRIDEEGRARIMDFGIARLQSSTMTRTGQMVGTPAYMAPEQVSGGAITPQTDIFSVGAVMYELCTGIRPFEGESLHSVFFKIVSEPPPEFSVVAPGLPASLNRIAMRALAKEPTGRYPSATDMASELTEARSKLGRVSSHPSQPKSLSLNASIASGLSDRTTKPLPVQQSRPQLIVAISVVALLVVASIGIAVSLLSRDGTGSTSSSAAPIQAPASQSTLPAPSPNAVVQTAAPTSTTPPAAQSKQAEKTPLRQQPKTEPAGPTAEELSLFRQLQTATLDARRRASEAGSGPDHLRAGDDHNALANSSLQQGRISDARAHLNLASTAWTGAEREARAAAAAAAQSKARAAEPKTEPTVPPPVTTSAPPAAPTVTQQPQRASVPSPGVEIEGIVANYERAIGTRDLSELRRAYPGMTTVQARGWEDFFKTLRSITASLSASGLDVRGDAADARITGAYDYVTTGGKAQRQPVNFQASFRREGGSWRLIAVR